MSLAGQSILAVVPARGGSKGLPRKNLRTVGGVSLVGRAGRVASACDFIDARLLSTDDAEIAAEGRRHGLDVPFLRPDELASDGASSKDMWRHAWLAAEAHYGMGFNMSVLLEPTSPLRRPEDVRRTVEVLLASGAGAAATVSRTPAHYTPHKSLTLDDAYRIGFFLTTGTDNSNRHTIPPLFHRNGICYAVTRDQLLERNRVMEADAIAVIIDREVVNIDDPFELELAEWLLEREAGHA